MVEARPAGDPGPYISVSVVTATSPTGDVSDASLAILQFDVNYDLVLTHDAPTSVAQGATHPHLITITNTGPAAALGSTMLTLTVDTSTPFKSYTGDGWLCAATGSEVTCSSQANLDAGASTMVTLNVSINGEIDTTSSSQVKVAAAKGANDTDRTTTYSMLSSRSSNCQ